MDAIDRVMPHSLDAERAVLGAILVSERAWPVVASSIVATDFFRSAHQSIFGALQHLATLGVTLDLITLKEQLGKSGQLDEVGGPAYIAGLTDGVPRSSNVEHYAAIVREKARLRAVIHYANKMTASAYEESAPAAQLIDEAVAELTASIRTEAQGTVTAAQAVKQYAEAMSSGTIGDPVLSGFEDIDDLTGGFRPADLVLVAARPSVGKTSLVLEIADHIATAGKVVLFFTLEMAVTGLAERLVAWRSRVPAAAAARGTATPEQYGKVNDAVYGFADSPLIFQGTASTLTEMAGWCRRIQQERGALSAVVIDYLQLMIPEVRQQSQEAEVAGISRGLKRLAKELKTTVVALSQLNRAPEARSDKRPQTADLRGSGALEQDADVVILMHRPEMYKPTEDNAGVAEIIVAKQRNGPTGITRLFFNKDLARFDNLAWRTGEER